MTRAPKYYGSFNTSSLLKRKQVFMQTYGLLRKAPLEDSLSRDGENFTNEEIDLLLDLWLSGASLSTIAYELKRSKETIQNKVWKVTVVFYAADERYKPTYHRLNRAGQPFTVRDCRIIKNARSEHSNNTTNEHIAKVLGRLAIEIENRDKRLARRKRGFGLNESSQTKKTSRRTKGATLARNTSVQRGAGYAAVEPEPFAGH